MKRTYWICLNGLTKETILVAPPKTIGKDTYIKKILANYIRLKSTVRRL